MRIPSAYTVHQVPTARPAEPTPKAAAKAAAPGPVSDERESVRELLRLLEPKGRVLDIKV